VGGSTNTPILNLDLPVWLSPRVLNALKADARTVDLRALAGWFYGGVARVLELFEEEEIGDLVAEVCFIFLVFWRSWGGMIGIL
jgi:GINS complex subunit 3